MIVGDVDRHAARGEGARAGDGQAQSRVVQLSLGRSAQGVLSGQCLAQLLVLAQQCGRGRAAAVGVRLRGRLVGVSACV